MNNPSHRLDSRSLRDEATGARGQLKPLMRHNQGANSRNLLNSLALKRERMGIKRIASWWKQIWCIECYTIPPVSGYIKEIGKSTQWCPACKRKVVP